MGLVPEPLAQKDIHCGHSEELWINVSIKQHVLLASPNGLVIQSLNTGAIVENRVVPLCRQRLRHSLQIERRDPTVSRGASEVEQGLTQQLDVMVDQSDAEETGTTPIITFPSGGELV